MNRLREVVFLSKGWAEAMIHPADESIISITDCKATPADLNDGWQAVLRVRFDDVDPDESTPGEFERDLVQISIEQAIEISTFVQSIATQTSTLVVHCKYGQSRSPAVAKAVCQHYNLRFPSKFNSHNRFVHRLVLNALSRHGGA